MNNITLEIKEKTENVPKKVTIDEGKNTTKIIPQEGKGRSLPKAAPKQQITNLYLQKIHRNNQIYRQLRRQEELRRQAELRHNQYIKEKENRLKQTQISNSNYHKKNIFNNFSHMNFTR